MNTKTLIIILLAGFITHIKGAETKLPSWEPTSSKIDYFVKFYNKDLAKLSAILSVNNNTNQVVKVGPYSIEQGKSITTPIELTPELQLTVGNVFDVTSNSGSRLGTLGINVRSRGYFMARHSKVYDDPKKVFETADVTLLLGEKQAPRFVRKEFDIYSLSKAVLNIQVNLKGADLDDSSVGIEID
ncbi:hypothetical protein Noda2021_10350 [Candidatus Dependentiae bacterium Noda2021]|nr:hypothetical protein Noda2021_10350 [Candidatus Dependentiae bacterium Noda2021]